MKEKRIIKRHDEELLIYHYDTMIYKHGRLHWIAMGTSTI